MKPIIFAACGLLACATVAAAGPHDKANQLVVHQQLDAIRAERRDLAAARRDLRLEQRELLKYRTVAHQRHRQPQLRYPRQVLRGLAEPGKVGRSGIRPPARRRAARQ